MTNFEDSIKNSKNILLISSRPLDLDCYASGIIMKHYLESLNLKITFRFPIKLLPEEIKRYQMLPLFKEFKCEDTRDLINQGDYDTLILLDGSVWEQFYNHENSSLPIPIIGKDKTVILIDHHPIIDNDFITYKVINPKASSAIEIVLSEIIPIDFLTKDLATIAYAGLVGDTGNFRYNFNPDTLQIASKLVEIGADTTMIVESMMHNKTRAYIEMLKYELENIEYDDDTKTIFLIINNEKLKKDGLSHNSYPLIKGVFVNDVARNIEGYPIGILITQSEDRKKVKVDVRGNNLTNKIDLPKLFLKLGGNGGGHFQATGLFIEADFDKFVKELKITIKAELLKAK